MTELTNDNFDAEVTKYKGAVIIDFYTQWCKPCRNFIPIFETISEEFKDKIKFCKLDTDNYIEECSYFSIKSIPTVIFIIDGKEIGRHMGFMPEDELKSFCNKFKNL